MTDYQQAEVAIWFDANETKDPIGERKAEITEAFDTKCRSMKARCGEIKFVILKPGEERVPPVPKYFEKIKDADPQLLVATADIKPIKSIFTGVSGGISGDLEKKDLEKLRAIVRKRHKKNRPNAVRLTDVECDEVIDACGQDVVLEQLRADQLH